MKMNRHSVALALAVAACKTAAPAPEAAAPQALPVTGGFQSAWLDRSVDPCDDFFHFACGGWLKSTPIPPDQTRWGSFDVLREKNTERLRELLEADAAGKGDPADPFTQKLGDFYGACMDEAAIEKTADAELAALLAPIDGVKDAASLEKVVAKLHAGGVRASAGGRGLVSPLFFFGEQQDLKDATLVIGDVDQSGLGLPDREYYRKTDPKSQALQTAYRSHIEASFALAGEKPEQAKADADAVYAFEKTLAEASQDRVFRRDPKNVYHRLELAGLVKAAPGFDWAAYLKDLGHPDVTQLNVDAPEFVAKIGELATQEKPETLRAYLRWNVISGAESALSMKFVDEDFKFVAQLTGQKELSPRWKRCVRSTDGALGFALGQAFVRKYYGAQGKAMSQQQIGAIEAAMRADLETLPWMDEATRKEGLLKLGKVFNKVGYPAEPRDYTKLGVARASYVGNRFAGIAFEHERELAKIGKPVDRGEWDMTPPTVNAYYNPSLNEMVFPAGILQPPFFNREAGADVNFGAIGVVMGHELTHGFDDEGAKFDGDGNLRDWFSPAALAEFNKRGECVAKQFDGYVAVDDVHVNGHLTEGENIADLGGVQLALKAARAARAGKTVPLSDGFSADQQVFLGFAQVWCGSRRDETARVLAATDPHAPPEWRVNGPLSNTPAFAEAFQCKAGAKLVRPEAERCQIW